MFNFKLQYYCTTFGQLILRKLIKIVATRCHILMLKCTKFHFGWGCAPDPAGGVHSAPQTPYVDFMGPTSKGREGKRGREKGGREEGGRGMRILRHGLRVGWTPLCLVKPNTQRQ